MTLKLSSTKIKTACVAAALLVLGACTATTGGADNPVTRKFQWFSYMEGGDFRDTCGHGETNRYRLIYNAVYTEQVRIYELSPRALSLHTRVMLPADVRSFSLNGLDGLLDPWRGKTAVTQLAASDVGAIISDLKASGVFGPPNVGTELASQGFFWTIAACHEGTYHFTGFSWPSQDWENIRFAETLFALDQTEIAINAPRKTKTSKFAYPANKGKVAVQQFHQKIGEQGLVRLSDLF